MLLSSLARRAAPAGTDGLFAAVLTKPTRTAVLHTTLREVLAPAERTLQAIEGAGGRRGLATPRPPARPRSGSCSPRTTP